MSVFVISVIRTWVPILIGGFIAWLVAVTGLPIPEEASASLVIFITMVAIGLYYLLIRWLEQKFPILGWFIGFAKAPALYVNPANPPASADTDLTNRVLNNTTIHQAQYEPQVHPEFMTRDQLAEKTGQDPSKPINWSAQGDQLAEPHNQMGVKAEGEDRSFDLRNDGRLTVGGDLIPEFKGKYGSYYVVLTDNTGLAHGFTVMALNSTDAELFARADARRDQVQGSLTLTSINRSEPRDRTPGPDHSTENP